MNKLEIFTNKKVPFEWDDIDWLQESVRNAFYGFLTAFGIDPADSFIISGCVVTIDTELLTASTTAGWISLDGEILKVEAHTISFTSGHAVVWRMLETNDPSGSETDYDGATVECYKIRQGKLTDVASTSGEMTVNGDTIWDKAKDNIFDHATSWAQLTLGAGFAHVTGNEVKYRVNKAGNVEIRGSFTASSSGGTLATLPAGFRPTAVQREQLFWDNDTLYYNTGESQWELQHIEVATSGVITIPTGHANTAVENYISCTLFK